MQKHTSAIPTGYFYFSLLKIGMPMILFGATGIASLDTAKNPPGAAKKGRGKTGISYTPTRVPVSFIYAVADIQDIIPSHLWEGNHLVDNPAFRMAGGVQPRDRGRLGSYAYIAEQAKNLIPDFLLESADVDSGAPVVGPNMTIEAGNGRWLILYMAYDLGKGGVYKRELVARAKQYGLNPEQIEGIERPILVRMRTTPLDVQAFAEAANVSRTLKLSPGELARQDSARLTPAILALFVPSETGEIYSRANRDFIRSFMSLVPAADRGELMTEQGELSVLGLYRIRNALMQKAYNDPDIIVRVAESIDANAKNLTNALVRLAPRYAGAIQRIASGDMFPALDISKDLVSAIRVYGRLKDDGVELKDYLGQLAMFSRELTPEQEELLRVLWEFSRSSKRVGEFLGKYLDIAEGFGSPKQIGFLSKPISKLEIIRRAREATAGGGGIGAGAVAPAEAITPAPASGKASRRVLKGAQEQKGIREEYEQAPPAIPSEVWSEASPETWTQKKPEKALEESRARGSQAFFVSGPRGGRRGIVMLSDLETFLKTHPTLRLKPIFK